MPYGALHRFAVRIDEVDLTHAILHAVATKEVEEANRVYALPALPVDDIEGGALKQLSRHRA